MPNVCEKRRGYIDLWNDAPKTPGELHYQISQLLVTYLLAHGINDQSCNDIVGALDNAKHDFRRHVQDPHEDLTGFNVYETIPLKS